MYDELAGKVAIVTGGGQGLGRTFARRLAEQGTTVIVAEVNPATAEATAAELTSEGHTAVAYVVDVSQRSDIEALCGDVLSRFSRVDLLVNNAGVAAGGPSLDVSEAEWDRVYGIMLKGVFLCCQVFGRVMLDQKAGSIVNICSMSGVGGWSQRALYTPAKAGVIALTQVLGCEWAPHGVRVNGISPGQVETPMNEYNFARGLADRATYANRAPMRRAADTNEIADALLFLLSDEARYITAEVVTIDGGWLAFGGIEEPVGV